MKLIVASTFREFDGSENDRIQRVFLEGLKNLKHTDLELVVTTFGERTVKKTIEESGLKNVVFEEETKDYRFSLTNVLLNALLYAQDLKTDYYIIWTTCDVFFESNLVEEILKVEKLSKKGTSIISHPHQISKDMEEFHNGTYVEHGPNDGIDFIGFSSRLISNEFIGDIKNNFFSDWGVFEHFLVAVAVKNRFDRYNLYPVNKARKICNDRTINNENDEYFRMSLNKNWPVLKKYIYNGKISSRYFSLVYCNFKFKVAGGLHSTLKYRVRFFRVYVHYFYQVIKSWVAFFLPRSIKDLMNKR